MITDLLLRHAAERPHRPFLVTDDVTLSFEETLNAVQAFAEQLDAAGVNPGDHVALLAGNSAAYVVAMLGVIWLGGVPVLLNNAIIGDGLGYALQQSDSRLVIADKAWIAARGDELDETLGSLRHVVLPEDWSLPSHAAHRCGPASVAVPGGAACTILYTSGTTGLPKGVISSHDCYEAVGRDTVACLGLSADDRIMVVLPLFHANPQMYALMSALTAGACLVVRPRFSASAFFENARRFAATGLTFVGTVLSILAKRFREPDRDHALRFAIGGGAPREVWEPSRIVSASGCTNSMG